MMPAAETPLLHLAEDPDRAWAEYGEHFLHEARTYASWQSTDIRSAVRSQATTVEELRARGRVPDRHAGRVRGAGRRESLRTASAVRRDAGGRGLAQPAAVLRERTAPAHRLSRGAVWPSLGARARSGQRGLAHLLQRLALGLRAPT